MSYEGGRIERNLYKVRARINKAAADAGRDPSEIKLVTVSKGRDIEQIREAVQAGQRVFGENRAQEMLKKLEQMGEGLEWHFVGHLQRNKVNMIVGKVKLIHSLDSGRLAEAIDGRADRLGITQDVLIQVNVSGEESKYGVEGTEVNSLLERVLSLSRLRMRGFMTIAPILSHGEEARPFFVKLREIRDHLAQRYPQVDMGILSMGMTQDFEVAVQEGANVVRIGTAVFDALPQDGEDKRP